MDVILDYKTIDRGSADFNKFLDGSFSSNLVALPVTSRNINTPQETVTFILKKKEEVKVPKIDFWFGVFRPELFSLIFLPLLFVVSLSLKASTEISFWSVAILCLSLIGLHIGTFLLNDYFDYMSGFDRASIGESKRVIKDGWMRAHAVKKLGYLALGFGLLSGVPFLWGGSNRLVLIGLVTVFLILGYLVKKGSLRRFGFGELIIFLGYGPLLFLGLQEALTGAVDARLFWIGGFAGYLTVLGFLVRQFETIMADHQFGKRTWVGLLGFDKSKSWLSFCLFSVIPLIYALGFYLFGTLTMAWVFLPTAFMVLLSIRDIQKISSPLSSRLFSLRKSMLMLHNISLLSLGIAFWMG